MSERRAGRCSRCNYDGDLAEHADVHPLCICCARSLREDETQTCTRCVGNLRVSIAEVVEMYAMLPDELLHHASDAIPGGDALVLLADGNCDVGSNDPHIIGFGGDGQVIRRRDVEATGVYYRADDPESVAATLAAWEDDWRHVFKHGRNTRPAKVIDAARYLNAQLDLASRTHLAFDGFAADLRRLVSCLERVTGSGERPERGAPCFDCGELLQRVYLDDGRADEWHCRTCRRVYADAEYWLAVRAEYERQVEANAGNAEGLEATG